MPITKWDEYLIHQAYDTIDAGVDVDRLYVACHDSGGNFHLAVGLGAYTKENIMDAFVLLRHKTMQYNMRLSRRLQCDRADTSVGPLTVKVIEPLKRWGIYLGENDYGIGFSVEFKGRLAPFLSKVSAFPFVHYGQQGHCSGSVFVDGSKIDVDGFMGARDRSWRVHMGQQTSAERPWFGHLAMGAQFSDCCLDLHGMPVWAGPPPEFHGALSYDDGRVIGIQELRHRMHYRPGIQALSTAELLLKCADGKDRHVVATPKSPALYIGTGAGYEHQGQDRGLLHVEGERWDVSELADVGSLYFGSTGMSEFIADFRLDGETGTGILETSYCPDKKIEYKPTW